MADLNLICGDALTELKKMPAASVDLIIADPPYNLGKDYGNGSDLRASEDYLRFTKDWLTEAKRVLSDTGTIYVFMGFRFIAYLYAIMEQDCGLHFRNWICWHYTQGIGKKRGFSPRHDDILMFTKSERYHFDLDAVRVPQKFYRSVNNMRGANPGDVWEFSHVHYCNDNRQAHPTQKPEGLIERLVLASSRPGQLVLDPFSGSGTTLRVCQQLGRAAMGIELNADYVAATQRRLAQPFTGFDSIDPRMKRIPNDLNDEAVRTAYLRNHETWFLANHGNAIDEFWKGVERKYGLKRKP
ncbi:site-specific DNA-methyltransferase [Flaviaesturariibacter amylovorans]|uniref:Methyltransferase n=1 Tax=Flaviaesturariibacter amylovorans TaxID=1084520 RepID=A0ABP8HSN1_9BACT